mmetsp:Transcript_76791/g.221882  ORF Transcript_76791/g.221882 Transcript_76791/m.221882 type:complete len:265 (+) Transcript_76791:323-1117(+)
MVVVPGPPELSPRRVLRLGVVRARDIHIDLLYVVVGEQDRGGQFVRHGSRRGLRRRRVSGLSRVRVFGHRVLRRRVCLHVLPDPLAPRPRHDGDRARRLGGRRDRVALRAEAVGTDLPHLLRSPLPHLCRLAEGAEQERQLVVCDGNPNAGDGARAPPQCVDGLALQLLRLRAAVGRGTALVGALLEAGDLVAAPRDGLRGGRQPPRPSSGRGVPPPKGSNELGVHRAQGGGGANGDQLDLEHAGQHGQGGPRVHLLFLGAQRW